jgi:hypothetical protein
LDLQQQRIEKAVSTELTNTPNVIKKTGLFDTLDKLYTEGPVSPETQAQTPPSPPEGMGGEPPLSPPPPPGAPEPGLETASIDKKFNVIFESNMTVDEYFDLGKGNKSIETLNEEFDKLLKDL